MPTGTDGGRRRLLSHALRGGLGLAASSVLGRLAHAEAGTGSRERKAASAGSRSLPTGRQYRLDAGHQRVVVTEVGATLRSYQVDGREFLWGFAETALPSNSNGQVLLPWPGRCEEGLYTFDGVPHQLAVNSAGGSIAQHGLVRFMNWSVVHHDARRLVLGLLLHPQPGYPFTLSLRQEYTVSDGGLVVTTSATNDGSATAPYATGMHPYFTVGTPQVDDTVLRVPARQYLPRAASGAATVPMRTVEGTMWDFRTAARVGSDRFTPAVCYGDLVRDEDGRARAMLSHVSGSPTVTVWTDRAMDYLTVYVPPGRSALAIEPCTAPSNALNHGLGLRALLPGETARSRFGVQIAT